MLITVHLDKVSSVLALAKTFEASIIFEDMKPFAIAWAILPPPINPTLNSSDASSFSSAIFSSLWQETVHLRFSD